MAKNRKRRADAVRLWQMARILLLAAACAAVGLGYVWQKNQIYRLGREIKQREMATEEAKRRNMQLLAQVAHLKSPAVLEERIHALNIKLVPPKANQIVRLTDPSKPPQPTMPAAPSATQPASTSRIPTTPASTLQPAPLRAPANR